MNTHCSPCSVPQSELDTVFSALMTGKVFVEDQIELERSGIQTGFKPGRLRKDLAEIDRAISIVSSQQDDWQRQFSDFASNK